MLDLDDVGAERCEDLGAVGPGQRTGQVEHAHAVEGPEGCQGAQATASKRARAATCAALGE
jgi:hypothetical protein